MFPSTLPAGSFYRTPVLRGKYTLHLAIGNMGTTRAHVMRAWEMVRRAARADEA